MTIGRRLATRPTRGGDEFEGFSEFVLGVGGVFFEEAVVALDDGFPMKAGEAGEVEIEGYFLKDEAGAAEEPVGADEVFAQGFGAGVGAGEGFGPGGGEGGEVLRGFVGQEEVLVHFWIQGAGLVG